MAISDRIESTIEEWSGKWKDRLRGWLAGALGFGIEVFMDVMAKSAAPKLKPLLDTLEKTGKVPPELKPLLDEMKSPTGEFAAALLSSTGNQIVGGSLGRVIDAILNPISYAISSLFRNVIPGPTDLIKMWQMRIIPPEELADLEHQHGFNDDWVKAYKSLFEMILPSDVIAPFALRNKEEGTYFWSQVRKLGWDERQIKLMQEMAYRVPGVADIIRYVVREVYDPATYKKFGQDQEYPSFAEADAEKTGVRPDHLLKEWIAHWELPGISQGFEMLHRGVIDEDTLRLLLRARDVMPYWRDKLTAISYIPYNRIDARRMWDMGVLDDSALKRSYLDMGYDPEHAENMTLWTKIFVLYPQLVARYKNGWITQDEVLSKLIGLGMKPDRAQWLFETKFKNEAASRTAAQKDLTLAQIIKGVKKGKITRAEAIDLVTDMGYDMDEANFILAVEIPEDETDTAVKVRELSKSDILAGLEAGTLTPEQAREKLVASRYTPGDADYILKVYLDSIKPPTEPAKREISKADVVAAVKRGLVTPEQGYQLLIKIGFSAEASNFILALVPQESPFSPATYDEYKRLTKTWRDTQGLAAEETIPEVQELKLQQARAVAEGRNPMLEQLRIQIDTIRRRRRKLLITREQELQELTALGVPADYIKALVENDDTRLAAKREA